MSALIETTDDFIFYPESDGKPMAENTKQFEWIVTIKEGLNAMLPRDFVAGDLLWYPVMSTITKNEAIFEHESLPTLVGKRKKSS